MLRIPPPISGVDFGALAALLHQELSVQGGGAFRVRFLGSRIECFTLMASHFLFGAGLRVGLSFVYVGFGVHGEECGFIETCSEARRPLEGKPSVFACLAVSISSILRPKP